MPDPHAATPLGPLVVQEPDARVQHVPEAVIQDVWATQRFDAAGLTTTAGDRVDVLDPGRLNGDGGPDFFGARVRIGPGAVVLLGDVEVHRTSGEWLVHRHHEDARYNRVVLHVTLVEDRHTGALRRHDGTLIPEVVLYDRLATSLRGLLHRFYAQPHPAFPCAPLWPTAPAELQRAWVRALGRERLRTKAARLADAFGRAPDVEALLYTSVFRALGYRPNADAMAELARRVPLALVRRAETAADVHALLLGAAGLLPEGPDPETHALSERAGRLLDTCGTRPMPVVQWQRARMRPANQPERRIAQAAALLAPAHDGGEPGLLRHDPLGRLREALGARDPVRGLRAPFEAIPGLGRERAGVLVADAVLPALLFDAEAREDAAQAARVLEAFGRLPATPDEVTRRYTTTDFAPAGALEVQGLHGLSRAYCEAGRCLACAVGQHLLGSGPGLPNLRGAATQGEDLR